MQKTKWYLKHVPIPLLLGFLGSVSGIVGIAVRAGTGPMSFVYSHWVWLLFTGLLFLLVLTYQTYLKFLWEYYDPTLLMKFEEQFEEMGDDDRKRAAEKLLDIKTRDLIKDVKKNRKSLDCIDPVLDILDTIGFYVDKGKISPEVAHQHIYYWSRGYWVAAREYIEAWRRVQGEQRRWEYVESLFDAVHAVESAVIGRSKNDELGIDKEKFLKEEAGIDE